MGMIQNIIDNFKRKEQEMQDIDDDETKDRYLRSLRRERRLQLEEVEKEKLKQLINEYRKTKLKEQLYGIKDERLKAAAKGIIQRKIDNKKVNILKNRRNLLKQKSLLNNKKDEFKKTKSSEATFLNKSNLI